MALDSIVRVLQQATLQTGRPDFAMIAGRRFAMSGLGPIGDLMLHSTTVGEALRSLVLHLHMHDLGAAPVIVSLDAETTLLGYSVYRFGTPALDLVYDTSTGIIHRILTTLCGPEFKAKAIQVPGQRAARGVLYRKHFGCATRFDSGVSGVVFSSRWMRRPVVGADPTRRVALQKSFAEAEARSRMNFGQRVEVVMQQMLLSGTANGPAISALFGISERTMRRRLGSENIGVRDLLNRARFEQARQMLQYTELPVGEIAATLQYRDANAFSRAFRSRAGCTATQWRARSRAGKWSG
jgi:AraC-like DNA-binding protein